MIGWMEIWPIAGLLVGFTPDEPPGFYRTALIPEREDQINLKGRHDVLGVIEE